MKASVCCVIGEHSVIKHCAARILQTTVDEAIWPSSHLGIMQCFAPDCLHYQSKDYGGNFLSVQLLVVFLLSSRAAHTNQHSDVTSRLIVCKLYVGRRFLCLYLWKGEQSNSL